MYTSSLKTYVHLKYTDVLRILVSQRHALGSCFSLSHSRGINEAKEKRKKNVEKELEAERERERELTWQNSIKVSGRP